MPDASLFTSIRNSSAIVAAGLSNGGLPKHNISGSVTSSLKQVGKSLPTSTVTIGSFGPLPSVSFKIENSSFTSLNNEQLKRLSNDYASILGLNPSNINLTLTEGSIVVNFNYLSGTNVNTLSPDEIGIINNLATQFSNGEATLNEFRSAINNANLNAYFNIGANTATSVTINVSPAVTMALNDRGNGVDPTMVAFSRGDKMYTFSEKNLLETNVVSGKCRKILEDIPEPVYSSRYSSRTFYFIGISYDDKYLTFADNIWSLANYNANIGFSEPPVGQSSVHRVNLLTGERQSVILFSEPKSITEQIFYNPFTDTLYDSVPSPGYDDLDSYRFTGLTTYVKAISTEKFYRDAPLTEQIYLNSQNMLFVENDVVIKRVNLVSGVVTTVIGIPQEIDPNDVKVRYNYDITSGPIQFAGLAAFSPVRHYSEYYDTLQVLDEYTGVLILIKNILTTTPTIDKVYGTPQPKDAQGYIRAIRYRVPNAKNAGRLTDGLNWTIPIMHYMDRYKNNSFVINGFGNYSNLTGPSDYWKLYSLYIVDGIFSSELKLFNTTPRSDDLTFELSPNGLYYICTGHMLGNKATGAITIPSIHNDKPVEQIGAGASKGFVGYTGITSLSIPDSIKTIGDDAFSGCINLRGPLKLSSIIQVIGKRAFQNCRNLSDRLILPNSLTTIGESAFAVCQNFTFNLVIPASVTSIGDSAFSGCSGITQLTIRNGITNIPKACFKECTGLTGEINIPNSVITIGESAFTSCTSLNGRLFIPNSVTSIGDYAFYKCTFTDELIIPTSLTTINTGVFEDCSGFTGILTIPANVTSIGKNAFSGCSGFTGELSIPEGITLLDENIFTKCSNFTSLKLPSTIQTIGLNAFSNCSNLRGTLYIPLAVNLAINAFANDPLLIIIRGNPPPPPPPPSFASRLLLRLETGNYYTVIGIKDAETIAPLVIPGLADDGKPIKVIGPKAMYNNPYITSVTINEGVVEVQDEAFALCSGIQSISIPSSMIEIGRSAFERCGSGPKTITFGPNCQLTHLRMAAFYQCGTITNELVIPDGPYASLEPLLFAKCIFNQGIRFTNNFKNCSGGGAPPFYSTSGGSFARTRPIYIALSNLPSRVKYDENSTGSRMFEFSTINGNVNLVNIEVISDSTFRHCAFINSTITMPNVTRIGERAFQDICGTTMPMTLPDSLEMIESLAFSVDYSGTQIHNLPRILVNTDRVLTLPNNVTQIYNSAFAGTRLKNIILPNNLPSIDNDVLSRMYIEDDVIIPNSVTVFEEGAFYGSTFNKSVSIPNNIVACRTDAFKSTAVLGTRTRLNSVLPASLTFLGKNSLPDFENIRVNGSIGGLTSITKDVYNDLGSSGYLSLTRYPSVSIENDGYFEYYLLPSTGTYMLLGIKLGIRPPDVPSFFFNGYKPVLLTIPATFNGKAVTHIKDYAFGDISSGSNFNTSFSNIVLSNNITHIGTSAFEGFTNLNGTLTIPDSVTHIGDRAFENIGGQDWTHAAFNNPATPLTVIVGSGVISMGCGIFPYNTKRVEFKDGCKAIGAFSFLRTENLGHIISIPPSVTSIGARAFYLKGVEAPSGLPNLNKIDGYAFDTCTFFNNLNFNSSYLTKIDTRTFYKIKINGTVTLPPNLTYIGPGMFSRSLVSGPLTIPTSVTIIEKYAFAFCTGLTGPLTLPSALTYLGNNAFLDCAGFTGTLTIPTGLTRIEYGTFENCSGLTGTLIIPSSVTYIGGSAFQNCSNLTTVIIEGTPRINFHAFKGCTKITGSYTTTGTTLVDSNAFEGCPLFTVNR